MKRITIYRIAAATLFLGALFTTACSKKDNPGATNLTLRDAVGQYVGTFDFTPEPSAINPDPQPETGLDVAFEVTSAGAVHFAEFPAATLVKALLGSSADAILSTLGTISYDATIGTPAADASQLSAALTTPQLRIDVGGMMVVLVTIEAPDPFLYLQSGDVTFTLKTTKCQLGEGAAAGEPFDLVNTLKFTAKKQ